MLHELTLNDKCESIIRIIKYAVTLEIRLSLNFDYVQEYSR